MSPQHPSVAASTAFDRALGTLRSATRGWRFVVWAGVAALSMAVLSTCSDSGARLRERFGAQASSAATRLPDANVFLQPRGELVNQSWHRTLGVSLDGDALVLDDKLGFLPWRGASRIPAARIDACSMACASKQDRRVVLIVQDIEIGIAMADSAVLRRWCWSNRVPIATAAQRRAWAAGVGGLPGREASALLYAQAERTLWAACAGH